jgi:hypothetical protein
LAVLPENMVLLQFSWRRGSKDFKGQEVFLSSRSMDNLFLKRVNSWQGLVKKEQEPIFEKSIGLPHDLYFPLKMGFQLCVCSF